METESLLVIGQSPEQAESINSLLRNSGINIHTIFADSLTATEQRIQQNLPVLALFIADASAGIPIAGMCDLAEKYQLNLAIHYKPDETDVLLAFLERYACLGLNASQDDTLTMTIRRLMSTGQEARSAGQFQQRASELQERYNLLLDSAQDAIAYLHEGLHVYANRAYLKTLGLSTFTELETQSLLDLVYSDKVDIKQLVRDFGQQHYPEEPVLVEVRPPNGEPFDARLTFSPVRFNGESCVQLQLREQDPHALLQEELRRLQRTDTLTGLLNRGAFRDELARRMDTEHESGIRAILYLEPDDVQTLFNSLNVTGMDQLMVGIGQQIRQVLTGDDLISRFSDHGFCMYAERPDKSVMDELIRDLQTRLSTTRLETADQLVTTRCSIGYARAGAYSHSPEEVISQARMAWEEASHKGNAVVAFKPTVATSVNADQDHQWLERIRFALNHEAFYSIQQSIVNLEGESEGLFENISYFQEDSGNVRLDECLPVAERNDLASTIDRQLIPGLLQALAGSGDRHMISISSNSVVDFSFLNWLQHQMRDADVEAGQLILQISAHTANNHLKDTRRLMQEVRAMGSGFCLSGFDDQRRNSGLLESLDVDMVKLRRGLSENLANNSAHQEIIRNVVQAARPSGTQVIADEIHNTSDMAVLWQCGVKLVSGNFLSDNARVVGQ